MHSRRANRIGRRLAVSLSVALIGSGMLAPSVIDAADPRQAAIEQLAREQGGAPSDFEVVNERQATTRTGETLSALKLVDRRTGEIHSVYRDASGASGGITVLDAARQESAASLTVMELKADAPLRAAVSAAPVSRSLRVAMWLDADTGTAEDAVRAKHPEVRWLAGRPLVDDLETIRGLRAELWEARRAVYAAAADALRAQVDQAGGSIAYVSTSAPLVFVDVPAGGVQTLAARADVLSLGLEGTWGEQMSSAGPTVGANWTSGSADQGNGVRVGVVEYQNVRNSGDMSGQVVRSYSTTGSLSYGTGGGDHPTWVAGAVASRGSYAGVAPGADIVSASTGGYSPSLATDRAIIQAADWSVAPSGGDADIVNASIGQDTATGAEEARRYFDSISWEDGRLVVAASGNHGTFGNWDVVSPGTGYNVLTIGGVNDRGTAATGDDRLWYGSNGAAYRDRTDAGYNSHGDYNKPNVSAPSVSVRTANGIIGDGTSVASPIVAGIAAQLVARRPSLAAWPEGTRALIMAGAFRRTPMPSGGISTDHEGVGTASALWSNRILVNGDGLYGGYDIGAMSAGQTFVREINVAAGQRVRAALAWSSHTSGSSNTNKSNTLASDLDLRVIAPNGSVAGSYSWDNPYEVVDITATTAGTLRIEIRHDRFEASEEPFGLAWALSGPFFDADASPFLADILWAAREEITAGCGPGRFCPKDAVNREQMASFLRRAAEVPGSSVDRFTDDDSSQHEADINAIAAAEITAGCTSTRYCPRSAVTRAQMASFLVRTLHLPSSSHDYFTDDNGNQHENAINALAAAGVTGGCSATRYCPDASVTREQMAAFLHRGFTR
ncbi:MAG: S8 family peptidase [Candidatus Limnocylindria bacterium]